LLGHLGQVSLSWSCLFMGDDLEYLPKTGGLTFPGQNYPQCKLTLIFSCFLFKRREE
jgi:hypothetical protein